MPHYKSYINILYLVQLTCTLNCQYLVNVWQLYQMYCYFCMMCLQLFCMCLLWLWTVKECTKTSLWLRNVLRCRKCHGGQSGIQCKSFAMESLASLVDLVVVQDNLKFALIKDCITEFPLWFREVFISSTQSSLNTIDKSTTRYCGVTKVWSKELQKSLDIFIIPQ